MKKTYFSFLLSILILSCGTSKYKSQLTSNSFKDNNCPDFKIKHNISASSRDVIVQNLDILPLFYDISLRSSKNDSIPTIEREMLTKRLESIVFNCLSSEEITYQSYSFSDFSSSEINDYKLSVRSSSFAFAHNHYESKKYYTKSIEQIGNERYKLAFFFQFFPKNNGEFERTYVHTMLYDTIKKENVYYEYLIYENCSVRYLDNFEKVIDAIVLNFKNRNMTLEK